MYTIVKFSPTGNTAYIADHLANYLGNSKIYALEHTDAKTLEGEHLVLLSVIHAFNLPRIVKKFVEMLPKDKFQSVSLIAVGCNDLWMNMAATRQIRKVLEDKNFKIIVDEVIAMPLNFVMSFPEDLIQDQLKTADNRLLEISKYIEEGLSTEKQLPFRALLLNKIGLVEPFAARFFGLELHAKKSCIQCGLCIKECPSQNIKMTNKGRIKFAFKCIMCMRCIYKCPSNAITPRISKFIPKSNYSVENYIHKGAKDE